MAWGRKTGTIDDVATLVTRYTFADSESEQEQCLVALDNALTNVPMKIRRKAGPAVVDALWAVEAQRVHTTTGEDGDLVVAKLGALGSEALGGSDPRKSLAHLPATDIARFFRKLGDWYIEG